MPAAGTMALFLLAALALLLIPGPAVLYITTRSIAHGRRAGLASVLGVELAGLTHVAAATLGLSALLMTSAVAFSAVKYLGAAYLIYLGARTLLAKDGSEPAGSAPGGASRFLVHGYIVNLLNPKTALFFLAFLPQFVDPHRGAVGAQVLLLGISFVGLATCTDGLYALLAGTLGARLAANGRFRRARRYVTGGIYIGLGMSAALAGSERT